LLKVRDAEGRACGAGACESRASEAGADLVREAWGMGGRGWVREACIPRQGLGETSQLKWEETGYQGGVLGQSRLQAGKRCRRAQARGAAR
jgi:hypothetical protein